MEALASVKPVCEHIQDFPWNKEQSHVNRIRTFPEIVHDCWPQSKYLAKMPMGHMPDSRL